MPDNNPSAPEKESKIEDIFEHEDRGAQPTREVREKPVETTKEAKPEFRPEQRQTEKAEDESARRRYAPPPPIAPAAPPAIKSEQLKKIETILSEHLDELFLQMTPQQQMAFKQKGEETADKVEKLLQETKVKIKEILNLIKEWLRLIPGINKFFLEQEAKIKTDRLLNLREQKQK